MSDLRFKITDQSEEAIRSRAAESVIWNENEARVPTRISDALWAAVRDRESLLGLLREARATPTHPHDGYAYAGCSCSCCLAFRALDKEPKP